MCFLSASSASSASSHVSCYLLFCEINQRLVDIWFLLHFDWCRSFYKPIQPRRHLHTENIRLAGVFSQTDNHLKQHLNHCETQKSLWMLQRKCMRECWTTTFYTLKVFDNLKKCTKRKLIWFIVCPDSSSLLIEETLTALLYFVEMIHRNHQK